MVRREALIIAMIALLAPGLLLSGCSDGGTSSSVTPSPAAGLTMEPPSGPVGTILSFAGADFSTTQSVTVGGTPAIPLTRSSTRLEAFVMPETTSGPVSVMTASGMFTAPQTFTVSTARATSFAQQGPRLFGTGGEGFASIQQGEAVDISADGNTAIVGAPNDAFGTGAAWVFTRTNGVWTQLGPKLVGTGGVRTVGRERQGTAVSISADGNTAAVGGSGDNGGVGAVWVFTRTNGVWSQQGQKLVGTGDVEGAGQGRSVALSADGNTLLIGGPGDNGLVGAAWVFTRTNGMWMQQGQKLVGTGAQLGSGQGLSLALSPGGTTAVVGGPSDDLSVGAVWVFTRTGDSWSQQGEKLIGSGAVGRAGQGSSVAVSASGNTILVGGPGDADASGAVWVFTRTGGVWTQQGSKLTATGNVGPAAFGRSVDLSADGNIAVVGGYRDDGENGAAWVFVCAGESWRQEGSKLVGTGVVQPLAGQGRAVALSANGRTAVIGSWDGFWIFAS
jgi:hypothetical protein